jgi:hypothetical protein
MMGLEEMVGKKWFPSETLAHIKQITLCESAQGNKSYGGMGQNKIQVKSINRGGHAFRDSFGPHGVRVDKCDVKLMSLNMIY